jgi:hypothetical protein
MLRKIELSNEINPFNTQWLSENFNLNPTDVVKAEFDPLKQNIIYKIEFVNREAASRFSQGMKANNISCDIYDKTVELNKHDREKIINAASAALMNQAQLDLLEEYIGESGNFTSTILDAKQPDIPTKILYLNKAITEDSITFKESLDALEKSLNIFNETENKANSHERAEIISSFKVIHDLHFNNKLNFTYGDNFPTTIQVLALDHYFKGTGPIYPKKFREAIKSSLEQHIKSRECLYYTQFPAEFWKNSIRNEFILKQDKLNETEDGRFTNEENPILKAKFWQEIYKRIEKKLTSIFPHTILGL